MTEKIEISSLLLFFLKFSILKKNMVSVDVHPKQRSLELYSFFSQACHLDFTITLALFLTVNDPVQGKTKKLTQIFVFTLLCGASDRFMNALKLVFISI